MSTSSKSKQDRKASGAIILDPESLEQILHGIRSMVDGFGNVMEKYPVDIEGTVRFVAVAEKCRKAREELGLSIKELAATLKVNQHWIKAIEQNTVAEIDGQLLHDYIQALGLERWFAKWKKANKEYYARLKAQSTVKRKK